MAKCVELGRKVMRTIASLHHNKAGCQIGKPALDLTARPLLTQDDRAPLIKADDVERVLANVNFTAISAAVVLSMACSFDTEPHPL